ncbi:glutathione-dependent formaldehyde dehydrogenase [Nocardia sp. MDA0666]|uniref:zinc-binding dehydrogenase n=1 Tax=Nocardia sp. MDA0666 TaxID=2135448 RepID=UPI000D139CD1|nr:alcohol dehydrogenase catalytic domain-containing protein [Nocardia sp. MDA0666]PSR70374.1 glutathione-dependent formaldehyde dehydrogenase [Nocardia sp. MDA0666]
MRALCWNGVNDLAVETVPDPSVVNPHDAVVAVRLTTTCGSDLHFIDGYLPGMRHGDVFGHEFVGDVVAVGSEVTHRGVGDRVVVPSFIGSGSCWFCGHDLWAACDTTGLMGAEFCDISPGDTVAIWGSGGVGLMAGHSARLLGAERVIVIDRYRERLALAHKHFDAETIDYTAVDSVQNTIAEMTGGRGPDACIDAVGMEGHGTGLQHAYDRVKQLLRLETDRATPLREAILACRKGGVVSVLGIYGLTDKFPMAVVTNKSLTIRSAQQHGQRYVRRIFDYIQQGDLDPSYLITHDLPLEDAVRGYDLFKNKREGCVRAIFRP